MGKANKSFFTRDIIYLKRFLPDSHKVKYRKCLGDYCEGSYFKSTWVGHRICDHCESVRNSREKMEELRNERRMGMAEETTMPLNQSETPLISTID